MKMRTLTAIKPHKYGTRHLTAGEDYEAPPRHAIALVASKKARFAEDKTKRARPAAPAPTAAAPQSEPPQVDHAVGAMTSEATLDRLRQEATQLGIDFDGRWGVARLQHEIAQAKR